MSNEDSPALPVDQFDDEFDLDIPPTSGQEYLRRVIQEARQCPAVVVADIDRKAYADRQTVKVSAGNGLLEPPSGYAPSLEWQHHQASEFSRVRQKLARYKARMRKDNTMKAVALPSKDDIEGWCRLSFGRLKPHLTSPNQVLKEKPHPDTVDEPSLGGESVGKPPLLSTLIYMNQPTVLNVLEYHINWFEATGFSKHQGEWLYALLVCLEKPLDPEACSLLRTLSRNCASLRATLEDANHPFLTPLNLFICLVARYFDQSDMGDTG